MNQLCLTMGQCLAGVEKNRSATSLHASDGHRKASMKPKRPAVTIRLGHFYSTHPFSSLFIPFHPFSSLFWVFFSFCVATSVGINAALPSNLGGKNLWA